MSLHKGVVKCRDPFSVRCLRDWPAKNLARAQTIREQSRARWGTDSREVEEVLRSRRTFSTAWSELQPVASERFEAWSPRRHANTGATRRARRLEHRDEFVKLARSRPSRELRVLHKIVEETHLEKQVILVDRSEIRLLEGSEASIIPWTSSKTSGSRSARSILCGVSRSDSGTELVL